MSDAPVFDIDPSSFWQDPYPALRQMQESCPIAYVPQLGATLITRRHVISKCEKKVRVFSSDQPEGLMTKLMGQNMMRKDGQAHRIERRAMASSLSEHTVRDVWKPAFEKATCAIMDELVPLGRADMVSDIAMRISGEALKLLTGLTNMSWQELDRVSQGMIDGCANYTGDPAVEARCHDATDTIDRMIDEMIPSLVAAPDESLLSVQMQAGLQPAQYRANIKLAISGGQNEPRDAIAGIVWALLTHPDQLALITSGQATWLHAFEEYARWISPIGMSPRQIAERHVVEGVTLEPGDRVFFMFGAGNRDDTVFDKPDEFDITRDTTSSLAFGAGPHFCAGAAASRCMIAEVALPLIFEHLKGLRLSGDVPFGGWAFRGPLNMPVAWNC